MSFKNTMKLFASNFSLVWKQVLYFLLCFIAFFILSIQVAKPIIEILKNEGIGSEIEGLFSSIYTMQAKAYFSIFDIIRHIFSIIAINFKQIYLSLILLVFTALLLPYIVFQMSTYNLSSVIYKKLSMNMNVSYFQNFIETLKESFLYSITNIVLSLPFWTAKILLLELYLAFCNNIFIGFLGMICLSTLYILLDSIKTTLFTCYTGYYIENNNTAPFRCFSESITLSSSKFWNVLSSSIIITLIITVANGFLALFTFAAGLIVSIPATFVIYAIFNIVVYFNKTGQRYYLGNNFIFNPTKYTVKQDENAPKYLTMEEPVEEQVITTISLNQNKHKKNR